MINDQDKIIVTCQRCSVRKVIEVLNLESLDCTPGLLVSLEESA